MFQLEEPPSRDVFSGHGGGVPERGSNIATGWLPASRQEAGALTPPSWHLQPVL